MVSDGGEAPGRMATGSFVAAQLKDLADSPRTVRWPFRVLALFFVTAAGLAAFGLARGWLRGEWVLGWDSLGSTAMLAGCVVLTLMFGWAAATGRVPDRLWRVYQRFLRLQ